MSHRLAEEICRLERRKAGLEKLMKVVSVMDDQQLEGVLHELLNGRNFPERY